MAKRSNTSGEQTTDQKNGLHIRNKNNMRYDLPLLMEAYPELTRFLFTNKHHKNTIDFSDPDAVRTLNAVLLKYHYGLTYWEIPKEYLCPPVPGRADYIHYAADLLASSKNGIIPNGNGVTILDIGTGSSCIYPLIGHREYGWRFVGTDVDAVSIDSARKILAKNQIPRSQIEIREQQHSEHIFNGIINSDERFEMTVCNPPFHSSIAQAIAGTKRKWKNLGIPKERSGLLNFGGRQNELVYPGGEEHFIKTMIRESAEVSTNVLWFTTLVSRQTLLPVIGETLKQYHAADVKIVSMAQGQKKSRFVAWTFQTTEEQKRWFKERSK
jgi:23S rRNA (adenine1618-N6)-methyltransferase